MFVKELVFFNKLKNHFQLLFQKHLKKTIKINYNFNILILQICSKSNKKKTNLLIDKIN